MTFFRRTLVPAPFDPCSSMSVLTTSSLMWTLQRPPPLSRPSAWPSDAPPRASAKETCQSSTSSLTCEGLLFSKLLFSSEDCRWSTHLTHDLTHSLVDLDEEPESLEHGLVDTYKAYCAKTNSAPNFNVITHIKTLAESRARGLCWPFISGDAS